MRRREIIFNCRHQVISHFHWLSPTRLPRVTWSRSPLCTVAEMLWFSTMCLGCLAPTAPRTVILSGLTTSLPCSASASSQRQAPSRLCGVRWFSAATANELLSIFSLLLRYLLPSVFPRYDGYPDLAVIADSINNTKISLPFCTYLPHKPNGRVVLVACLPLRFIFRGDEHLF